MTSGEDQDYVLGNFLLCGLDQFSFFRTSRKEDLLTLLNLMVYMLHDKKMPYLNLDKEIWDGYDFYF